LKEFGENNRSEPDSHQLELLAPNFPRLELSEMYKAAGHTDQLGGTRLALLDFG